MRVLITAGPTREPIDAVRFLSNRSSGAMGVALAEAGARAGHAVTLLLGPTCLVPVELPDLTLIRFETTDELEAALQEQLPGFDLLIMAAAVSDYRPIHQVAGKVERAQGESGLSRIELESTPDLVAGCASRKRSDQAVVAFALEEPEKLRERALAKMQRKGVDAIVANPLQTMDAKTIEAELFRADGQTTRFGKMTKPAFAQALLKELSELVPVKNQAH